MEQQELSAQNRVREEITQFVALFPQVKPEEIPQAVWQKVKQGASLTLAYCMDRLDRLERENALLQAKARGSALSPGSVSSAGASGGDTLASYWDAYQM